MCGRFAFDVDIGELRNRFSATADMDRVSLHYNVAPGMFMPIIVRKNPNCAILARWGAYSLLEQRSQDRIPHDKRPGGECC